jgi:CRISPR/Cas system-associated protein endoribonuclease Cas2
MPGMSIDMQHKTPPVMFVKKFRMFLLSAGFLLAAVWIASRILELKLR